MLSFIPNHELFKVRMMQDVLWLLCSQHKTSEAMKVQALTTVCAGEWSSMLNILSLVSIIRVIELFGNYIIFLTW